MTIMLLGKGEFSRLAAAGSSYDGFVGGLVRRSQLAWIGRVFSRKGCGYWVANDHLRGDWVMDQLVIGQLAVAMAFCDEKNGMLIVGADGTSR
jgi:hypothetical protein